MTVQEDFKRENIYKEIYIICPTCETTKVLKIPAKIINSSGQLTTVSIPSGSVCEHSFQAFVDKDFNIRGYQAVDFEISKIEYYEKVLEGEQENQELIVNYTFSLVIREIINLLRESVAEKEILGGAIFSIDGNVIYSSLPDDIYFDINHEFENRTKQNLMNLKQLFMVLENYQKIFSEYIEIQGINLVLVLFISSEIGVSKGAQYLRELMDNIITLNITDKDKEKMTSDYWLFSRILLKDLQKRGDSIRMDSLGIQVSKSVILNLKEISEICKHHEFEGKIFIAEKYVKLMAGLAKTIRNAAIFVNNLNKMP